ncbi:MAG: helix-turn-helix domain-containing protein [Duncaniella sp.]|nr:helix-turn-helix domain-containing protein [Duncaniella sp.]
MTVEEAAQYIGVRKSYIYTLTSTREIPYYKPGKKVLIRRVDLDSYIKDRRVKPMREIRSEAIAYCDSRRGSKSSPARSGRGG